LIKKQLNSKDFEDFESFEVFAVKF